MVGAVALGAAELDERLGGALHPVGDGGLDGVGRDLVAGAVAVGAGLLRGKGAHGGRGRAGGLDARDAGAHLVDGDQRAPAGRARLRVLDGLVQHPPEKAHAHAGELEAAPVQHVQHHLDAARVRLQPVRGRHAHVDFVAAVGQDAEAEVGVELLDLDVLAGLRDVAHEKADVAPEAALALLARREQPVVGPAGEAAPVLGALDVVVAALLLERRFHLERVRAVVGLGDHEPAHAAALEKAAEHLALGRLLAVLGERLQEEGAVDAHHERERQALVARRLQHREALFDVAAAPAVLGRDVDAQRVGVGGEARRGAVLAQRVERERRDAARQVELVEVQAVLEDRRQALAVAGEEVGELRELLARRGLRRGEGFLHGVGGGREGAADAVAELLGPLGEALGAVGDREAEAVSSERRGAVTGRRRGHEQAEREKRRR